LNNTITSLCPRCGQKRIIGKHWDEIIKTYTGSSTITHTTLICPDDSCQQAVDNDIAANKERVRILIKEKEEKIQAMRDKRQMELLKPTQSR
jgi:hypothetical protein